MDTLFSFLTRITDVPRDDVWPTWSPDGTRLAFASNRDFNSEIYLVNANGSGLTRLTDNEAIDATPAWSPDGTRIAFYSSREGRRDVYVMSTDGSGLVRLTNDQTQSQAAAP